MIQDVCSEACEAKRPPCAEDDSGCFVPFVIILGERNDSAGERECAENMEAHERDDKDGHKRCCGEYRLVEVVDRGPKRKTDFLGLE